MPDVNLMTRPFKMEVKADLYWVRVIFAIRQNFHESSFCEVICSLVLPTRTKMLNHGGMIIIIDQICSS